MFTSQTLTSLKLSFGILSLFKTSVAEISKQSLFGILSLFKTSVAEISKQSLFWEKRF